MTKSQRIIAAIAENAQRLASDSRILFENGRYSTSLSIAILSLEESGKILILRREELRDVENLLRSHIKKQIATSTFLTAEVIVKHYIKAMEERGYELKEFDIMTDEQRKWTESDVGKNLLSNPFQNGVLDDVFGRLSSDNLYKDMVEIKSGYLSELKNRGFYVDADNKVVEVGVSTKTCVQFGWGEQNV